MSIYRFTGNSLKGKSHEQSGTVCQDSYFYLENGGFVVAAVADGLGSSKHSDIASKMAAKAAVEYCASKINKKMRESDILSIIRTAFDNTNFTIKQTAGENLDDYDTTLSLAVLIQGNLYYGHAGDSGIIAMRKDGTFDEVTEPQLGDGAGKERPVYPLAAESKWVFGKYPHQTHAIFLMTDGILNKAIPPLLDDQKYKLDNAYLYYLYDNLRKNPNLDGWISDELTHILPQEVNYDDITVVAVMCKSVKVRLKKGDYYKFPGEALWSSLLEAHRNRLYSYRTDSAYQEAPEVSQAAPPIQAPGGTHTVITQQNQKTQRKRQGRNKKRQFLIAVILAVLFVLALAAIALGVVGLIKQMNLN